MGNKHKIIAEDSVSKRLDQYIFQELSRLHPESFSRSQITNSIKEGNCEINSRIINKPSATLKAGDIIEISIFAPKISIEPDPAIKFEVLFEDETLMVISKPAGLVVHPASGTKGSTLVHGLYAHLMETDELSSVEEDQDEHERLGIVHRLDKDTSGCMVIAKTMIAKRHLQNQLQPPRRMKRIYQAIIFGNFAKKRGVEETFDNNSRLTQLKLSAPISRHPIERIKFKVDFKDESAREATTYFRILPQMAIFI